MDDDQDWERLAEQSDIGHGGPWPAFVDLFAATTLVILVLFVLIAARYIRDLGDSVKMQELFDVLEREQARAQGFTVQQQTPDVLLILEEDVTFPTGQWQIWSLKATGKQKLRVVNEILKREGFSGLIREIEIVGHADRRGGRAANLELSTDRAVTVAQFFIDSLGVDPCTIVPSGRGPFFPRDSTVDPDTLRGMRRDSVLAADRRIEILLHPVVAGDLDSGRKGCLEAQR